MREAGSFKDDVLASKGFVLNTPSLPIRTSRQRIELKCSKGHLFNTTWNKIQSGNGCPVCYKESRIPNYKEVLSTRGYELVSIENNPNKPFSKQYFTLKCSLGHEFKMVWNNIQQGQDCPVCAHEKRKDKLRHDYEHIKGVIESKGFKLLTTEYFKNNQKLRLVCLRGHEFKSSYSLISNDCGCPICNGGVKKPNDSLIKELEGFGLVQTGGVYNNQHSKITVKCSLGHEYVTSFSAIRRLKECRVCKEQVHRSKGEIEVYEFVKSNYNGKVLPNDRTTVVNPLTQMSLELDIWMPESRKAIEYNGEYWHKQKYQRYKDEIKQRFCNENNIDLLIIHEQDWINNRVYVERKIHDLLIKDPHA